MKIDLEGAEVLVLDGGIGTQVNENRHYDNRISFSWRLYHIIKLLEELGYSITSKKRHQIHKNPEYTKGHIRAKLIRR